MALTTDVQEKDRWECKTSKHIQGWPLSLRQLDKRAFGSVSTEGYSCTPYILMRTHRTHTASPRGTRKQGTCRGFLAQGALDISGYLLALCSSLLLLSLSSLSPIPHMACCLLFGKSRVL